MTSYNTIEKPSSAEFKDRGSKFIAYAFPVSSAEDFKQRLNDIKKEHPKATHHCFAYRLGTDGKIIGYANHNAGKHAFVSKPGFAGKYFY